MKIIIALAAVAALTACDCGTLSTSHVASYVRKCNSAELDYEIVYNDKGKATDVICYKPGSRPPYPEMSTTVPATGGLEYVDGN